MTSSSAVFLLVITLLLITASSDLEEDTKALKSFMDQMKLPPKSKDKYNWDTSKHTCTWAGVVCGPDNNSVVTLRIPGASLVGEIPAKSLGKITSLRVLSLHDNGLSGSFPNDFADLDQLSYVYLYNNKFSGEFPSSLAQWKLLKELDLSYNRFSGELPDNVASSSKLVKFNVSNNNLSGRLPENMVSSSTLENFNVSNNNLRGRIPSSLARFPGNAFSGNIELCGQPLPKTCNGTDYPPSPSDSISSDVKNKKKKKKLSTGHIIAIAVGSGFILLILFLCLGKKWSRVKDKKTPGVATLAARAKAGEAGTSS